MRLTGDAYINAKAMDGFIRNLFQSLLFASLQIFGIIAFLFWSLRVGIIAVIPNTVPLAVTLGYIGLRGYDLNDPNDPSNTRPAQTQVVYVNANPNPYPYWYGYPSWYAYPYWYPASVWTHVGFRWGGGGTYVGIGLPSPYFLGWYGNYYGGGYGGGGYNGSTGNLLGALFGLATEAALVAADRPDTRSWSLLPGRILATRVRVPAGDHAIEVGFGTEGVPPRPFQVHVKPGGLATES